MTCMTHNGEGIIDLVLTCYLNFEYIVDFKVHNYTVYSNHAPVSFGLKVYHQNNVKIMVGIHTINGIRSSENNSGMIFFSDENVLDDILENANNSTDIKTQLLRKKTKFIVSRAEKYYKKT
jgi:hypothetical protein